MPAESTDRTEMTWWAPGTQQFTLGTLIDESAWVCFDNERTKDGAMAAFLRLSRSERGGLVCTGLVIGDIPTWAPRPPREVNAAVLRSIQIPRLIAGAVRLAGVDDDFGRGTRTLLAGLPAIAAARRPGPAGYPDEHFREVADAYRAALEAEPRAPTKWLAERMYVSLPTARRWIQRARDLGYLGASIPGKAGERKGKRKR